MYVLDTIQIDEDNRLVVTQDEYASDPVVESGCPVDLYVYRSGYSSATDTPSGEIGRVFSRFEEEFDADQALDMTRRYMKIFHGWTEESAQEQITIYNSPGNSPSDWADIFCAVEDPGYGTAEGWAEEWAQWANGEVYVVAHEKREKFTNADETREMDVWDEVDSLGGNYLDDEYTALDVARDNFSLTIK